MQPEIVVDHTCLLGEGPVWDHHLQQICWVDIENGQIHTYHPATDEHRILAVQQQVGCIALCRHSNEFIAGLKNGLARIKRDTGAITYITNPEEHLPGNRFNDGKCDPEGRFWAGTLSLTEEKGAGNLYRLDKNGLVTKVMSGLTISNGLAWSRDATTFFHIDSPTGEVAAWKYDSATGDLSTKRTVVRIPDGAGDPDGMTLDAEGMLWIAHWGGWQLSRWNPDTQKKLLSIPLPVEKITSCTFGGPELKDLYITTANRDLSEKELRKQPLAGSLFVIKNSNWQGLPAVEYNYQQN